jgi:2-oxoisovalerate dehydrogenase E2 component (dihydrolipoyl transacylase)
MARAALLRVLVARNAAGRAYMTAAAGASAAPLPRQPRSGAHAAASLAPPPRLLLLHALRNPTRPQDHLRAFATLSPAPASAAAAAAAAAASPARVADADAAPTPTSSNNTGVLVSFPLAQTGEGISECELVRWHVSAGDTVEEFQPLCEVQSDKASIEITSRFQGVVERVHHQEGEVVKVGAALVDIRLPAGVEAPPGSAVVGEDGGGGVVAKEEPQRAMASAPSTAAATEVLAPPAVRRLARELGVDLASIAPGTGVGGRLTKEDVQAAHDGRGGGAGAAAAVMPAPPPVAAPSPAPSSSSTPPTFERIPIRGYARTMLRTSTEALSVPMFYYFDEVRVDALARLRADLAGDPALAAAAASAAAPSSATTPPLKLTFLPFIIKALSVALAQHPTANASLDLGSDNNQPSPSQPSILRYKEHNVGVAMATPGGLVVPCVKNVQSKTVAEVAVELAELQRMASEGRVPPERLSGGTITVSNIGALGGTHATPLVHPPQAAIVALGRARALPRFSADGKVERHLLMDVSWGADHRVVDGAEVARLSNCWRALLEEPSRLLLHMR